jgi:hypothetical protein
MGFTIISNGTGTGNGTAGTGKGDLPVWGLTYYIHFTYPPSDQDKHGDLCLCCNSRPTHHLTRQ